MKLETDRIIAEQDDGIGWLIFNNPERRNAVSLAMREAITRVLETWAGDDSVRVLVLRGAGDKAFMSGADISEFKDKRQNAEAEAEYAKASARNREALQAFAKPTIAMIHGYCIGGGLATAVGCDLRIASEEAQFGIPAARLGLGYGYATLKELTDLVGPANAKEILFTGRRMSAAKAMRIGLVNEVVAPAELEAAVRQLAGDIAANAPLTIRAAKATIREISKDPGSRDLARVDAMIKACFDSRDYREGREAFMEKRKPVFEGR